MALNKRRSPVLTPQDDSWKVGEQDLSDVKDLTQKEVDAKDEKNEFLRCYPLQKVRLLNSSGTTKTLLSDYQNAEKVGVLLAGVNHIAKKNSEAFFRALLKESTNLTKIEVTKLFYESEPIVSKLPESLINELNEIYKVSMAEERGFLYDEKHRDYTFNANVFADHFLKRCNVQSEESGLLFLYSNTGVYKSLTEIEMGRVIREIMHEGRSNSWKSHYETEAYKALLRAAPSINEMNVHSKYINVKNGMFNLDTYELIPHSPKLLSTVQIPIEYDPEKVCPRFDHFLKEITKYHRQDPKYLA